MPRTRSLKWSELKIGVMAVVALLIAAALILALGGEGGFFWQRYNLKVKFPNAAGVQRGSPVRVAGVTVGAVQEITFVGSEVEMLLELRDDMQQRVRTTSRATIGSVSLLGEGAVDISASTSGDPIPEGGYVPTDRASSAAGRRHRPGQQGHCGADGADHRPAGGQGHSRQADDRRAAVCGAAAVHRGGPGSHRGALAGQRDARPAAQQPRKRAATGGVAEEPEHDYRRKSTPGRAHWGS